MLTRLRIRNFKQFEDVDIELGQSVVLIGPNNSGKTTALQALVLWVIGVELWYVPTDKMSELYFSSHQHNGWEFYGPVVNRLGISAIPVPSTQILWRNLHVMNSEPIPIEIQVEGITNDGRNWSYTFRFQYANSETFYCELGNNPDDLALTMCPPIVFLPPMSGLTAVEPRIERGRINVLIGEGRTAEVLRNLCLHVYEDKTHWETLVAHIREMFGVEILAPEYLTSRGEIRMAYKDRSGITLDLSSSGRGMLQILLLLAYMYTNPGAVLLLDEPDAHLEIIRQREIYQLLTTIARKQGSQIIAASHSEVVLEEASRKDTAIAFVGKPHRIDTRNKSQVLKALKEIPAVDYYLAEQKGWIIYLEGATDLAILQSFARLLGHEAAESLQRPFVYYTQINKPSKAQDHFYGLREAYPGLKGVVLFDRLKSRPKSNDELMQMTWRRREIENYLAMPEALIAYARQESQDAKRREQTMQEAIQLLVPPIALSNPSDKWWLDTKMSDDFLDRLFEIYFEKLGLPNLMRKTNYHVLAEFVPKDKIDPEVTEKLDAIVEVAKHARPRQD
jgi:ABC-type uncharacterized transport system ATPase subunit